MDNDSAIQSKLAAMFAANKDDVSVPKIYIDMTGDHGAACVLDEIMFWTLPKKGGKTSLRVYRDGKLWLAVRRSDWWDRKRLTERQADRAIEKLIALGMVEKDIFLFSGKPTVHLRLNMSKFVQLYGAEIMENSAENDENLTSDLSDLYSMMGFPIHQTVNSILPNGEMLNLPNGEMLILPNGEFINSPLTTPKQPEDNIVPFQTMKSITDSANRKVDSILAMEKNAPAVVWAGRELVRPDMLPLADWYHGATGQIMTKRVQKSWWKALGEWKAEGLTPADLQAAFTHRVKWRGTITDPNELTNDAVGIKAAGSVTPDARPTKKYDYGV